MGGLGGGECETAGAESGEGEAGGVGEGADDSFERGVGAAVVAVPAWGWRSANPILKR